MCVALLLQYTEQQIPNQTDLESRPDMTTNTLIRFAAALLLAAACSSTFAAAQLKDVVSPDADFQPATTTRTAPGSGGLKDVVSPDADFQYTAEQDLWVQIAAFDVEGAPADLRSVEILEALDAEGQETRVLDKGLTDATGTFERKVRVPVGTTQLTVRVGVFGIPNTATLDLDGSGVIVHTFE